MKLIYVAGPFRAESSWKIEQNIRRAETLALDVWAAGAAAICPHANTRYYQGALPDSVWLEGDIEMLSRCDAVLLVPGWEDSVGTREERRYALEHNIPVFDTFNDFFEWLCETSSTLPTS